MADSIGKLFSPSRPLGRTGFLATAVGAGDLADRSAGLEACATTLGRALDAGVNLVDTAPSYEDGFSEEVVGEALRGRREGVFVIDKIDHLDRPVRGQVGESLGRLGLSSVDLLCFHNVSTLEGWQKLVSPGGLMDELAACVGEGKARFRGVSTHHPEVARLAVLSGLCEVVMFPLGPLCDERYRTEIVPLCREKGVGSVCFKTFGAGKLVGDTEGYGKPLASGSSNLPRLSPAECVRYTLTVGPDVALLGLSTEAEQDQAFAAARSFSPMDEAQLAELRARAARAAEGKGHRWWDPGLAPPARPRQSMSELARRFLDRAGSCF